MFMFKNAEIWARIINLMKLTLTAQNMRKFIVEIDT